MVKIVIICTLVTICLQCLRELGNAEPKCLEELRSGKLSRFFEFSQRLDSFRSYVVMNYMAVLKVIKKHDKRNPRRISGDVVRLLVKQPFYVADVLSSLVSQVDALSLRMIACSSDGLSAEELFKCAICGRTLVNAVR